MPARPKYGKKRRPQQRTRPSEISRAPAATPPAATTPQPAAAARQKAAAPPPRTYPFIGGELRVIGILTAVTTLILLVLAFLLR